MMPNAARGETLLLVNGAPVRLCLTLGALAELEATLEAASLSELADRLSNLCAADLLIVIAALTSGGGASLSPGELAAAQIAPVEAAAAVARAFNLAFADEG